MIKGRGGLCGTCRKSFGGLKATENNRAALNSFGVELKGRAKRLKVTVIVMATVL